MKIAKSYDTPDWSPDKAQQEMEQAITALGKNGFNGVYAANDGTAGGAIAAMKGAGINPADQPTTGQDAELAAIQRILVGEQFMTVYKDVEPARRPRRPRSRSPSPRARTPPSGLVNQQVDNGQKKVPSVMLDPVAVTKDNINDTIIKDGFWTASRDLHRQVRQRLQGGRNRVAGFRRAGPQSARPGCPRFANERNA